LAAGLTARDVYNFATDPATERDAKIAEGVYGSDRHPGMMAPGDIERRYIDQQTRGPNVTTVSKNVPSDAMMGAQVPAGSTANYGVPQTKDPLLAALLSGRPAPEPESAPATASSPIPTGEALRAVLLNLKTPVLPSQSPFGDTFRSRGEVSRSRGQ
jgi:hypothetical protein